MSRPKHTVTIQSVIRERVQSLLQLSPELYSDYQYQQGIAYLESHLGLNILQSQLESSSLFWAWWRNHWHAIDTAFVDEAKNMSLAERQLWYETVHDVQDFSFTPHRSIMMDAIKNYQPVIKHYL